MNLLYLFTAFFYALGCCCLGLSLMSLLLEGDETRASIDWYAILASGFLLGQAIFANVWLVIGVAGFFSPLVIWATFLGTAGTAYILYQRNPIPFLEPVRASLAAFRSLSWFWQTLGLLIAVILLFFGVITAATPPIGDAAAFYMVLPKIMSAAQRLVPQPNYYQFSQIGLSGEMHAAALMSIASLAAAKVFVWFTLLALAGMLIALNTEVGNSSIGKIVSMALLITSTTATDYIFDGKVELFGAAFGLAAYYWALRTDSRRGKAPFILTGLFTGFAIIAKFTSIVSLVPGIIILLIWNNGTRKVGPQERYVGLLKALFVFGLTTACTLTPHLVKNYELFGEPLAPFLFFKSGGKALLDQPYFSTEATKFIIMTYPVALLYGQYPMQGGTMSALLAAFTPLLVLRRYADHAARQVRQITVVAAAGVVLWMIVRPSWIMPRYILATLLLFVPLVASGVERLYSKAGEYFILRQAVFLSMVLMVFTMAPYYGLSLSRLPMIKQFAGSLIPGQPDYSPSMSMKDIQVRDLVKPGERLYFAGYYTFFLTPEALQCMNSSDDFSLMETKQSKMRINWTDLYDRGFKYLFVDKSTHGSIERSIKTEPAPSWVSVTTVFEDEVSSMYAIGSKDPGREPSYTCRQIRPPAWDIVKTAAIGKP